MESPQHYWEERIAAVALAPPPLGDPGRTAAFHSVHSVTTNYYVPALNDQYADVQSVWSDDYLWEQGTGALRNMTVSPPDGDFMLDDYEMHYVFDKMASNEVYNYLLKLYLRLFAGIDLRERSFSLWPENTSTIQLSTSLIYSDASVGSRAASSNGAYMDSDEVTALAALGVSPQEGALASTLDRRHSNTGRKYLS